MQRVCLISVITITLALSFLPAAMAADSCPTPKGASPACSYSLMNRSCTVTIDRMNPVTPPTIYVHRYCSVTVKVINPTPLEELTLDWKSSATVIPPDAFQSVLSSLSGTLGKFTAAEVFTTHLQADSVAGNTRQLCEEKITSPCVTDASEISRAQSDVSDKLKKFDPFALAVAPMEQVRKALQPPPAGTALGTQPWMGTTNWKQPVTQQLQIAIDAISVFGPQLQNLAKEIVLFKGAHTTPKDKADSDVLDKNQTALTATYASIQPVAAKLNVLITALNAISAEKSEITFDNIIKVTGSDSKNYQTQTWSLDYTNQLLSAAKRVAADTLKSESATLLSGLADAPAKQPILTISVQFQTPSRVEVSSGLMIPLRPFRSYTKASVATNGTVTNNVVQQTKTYAVVPMAFVNFLAKEWATGQQRSGFFFTGGVGYNPATSAVEFGGGFTYSYRSLELSALVDIGRDTKLAGGFSVGQSLGLTNAATPITSTFWAVKPAAAISVRIPLGGSSGSSSSSSGSH